MSVIFSIFQLLNDQPDDSNNFGVLTYSKSVLEVSISISNSLLEISSINFIIVVNSKMLILLQFCLGLFTSHIVECIKYNTHKRLH